MPPPAILHESRVRSPSICTDTRFPASSVPAIGSFPARHNSSSCIRSPAAKPCPHWFCDPADAASRPVSTPLRSSSCRANCNEGPDALAARLGFAIRVCSLYRSRTAPVRRASQAFFRSVRPEPPLPWGTVQRRDPHHQTAEQSDPHLPRQLRPRPSGTAASRLVTLSSFCELRATFVTTAIRPTISRSAPRENAA